MINGHALFQKNFIPFSLPSLSKTYSIFTDTISRVQLFSNLLFFNLLIPRTLLLFLFYPCRKTLKIRCSTPKDLTIFQDSFFENNPQYSIFFILLSILGEHYTIQPHFSDSQYSYLTIKDINMNHTKKIVNLYGIIVSASRPLKNNRISFFPLSTRRERVQCQVPYSRSLF